MLKLVKWLWYFGDGSFSVEREPKHTYIAPGVYTVTLVVTDELGASYTFVKNEYIYAFAFPMGLLGLVSGFTDFCFRHAVKASQGQGISPFTGKWVWPMILSATAKGVSANNEALSLIVNADDMRIYQIGIAECWTDRDGSYDEAEIETTGLLPEITSRYGDHENVRHTETHISMRSWDELRYRGKTGYSKDGFRIAQQLSLDVFEGGEQVIPDASLQQVNRDGDYAFLKEIEGKRFQIKFKTTTSAFRITRIGVHAQEIDKRTPPQLNDIPQKRWQKEFNAPDLWFSRNKPSFNTNLADGIEWTGTGIAATAPDSSDKAMFSTGMTGTLSYAIDDFTVSAWIFGDGVIIESQVSGGGTFKIDVTAGVLTVSDGIDTTLVVLIDPAKWVYVTVIRRGSDFEVYENGVLKSILALSAVRSYGGATTIADGTVFDIRRIPRNVSAEAVYYYYETIIKNEGGFLP
jgi:PKD repeat protein